MGDECVKEIRVTLESFIVYIHGAASKTVLIYPIPCVFYEIVVTFVKSYETILGAVVRKKYNYVSVFVYQFKKKYSVFLMQQFSGILVSEPFILLWTSKSFCLLVNSLYLLY